MNERSFKSRSLNHKIRNARLFQKLFKQYPSRCEDSPTKGVYKLFLVRWPWPSFKITIASQPWQLLIQRHSGSAYETNQRWTISTSKQVIRAKLATIVVYFFHDCDFENIYMAWPTCFLLYPEFLHTSERRFFQSLLWCCPRSLIMWPLFPLLPSALSSFSVSLMMKRYTEHCPSMLSSVLIWLDSLSPRNAFHQCVAGTFCLHVFKLWRTRL